ncbi:tubulin epsilon and delta complex protein 1 [Dryobates pubescens]|uniref:tubulin epsilon and delta complex protein 1 n=1 Tax=Dryobates pubescens TaxID=118200 RepID=UPI0023BA2A62|nr:tubulin epsilon and delta complex protein 1 [Dryobates pubescens]
MRRRAPQGRRGAPLPAAVAALCRALPPRARPAPDTLRRAKFDRPQASLDLWRLLYTLLKDIHGGKGTESDAIDEQVRAVKAALWFQGYGRPGLHRLPRDGSAGGRELLLAFSWLLHRLSLPEQLLARHRVQTGDHTSVCTCEADVAGRQEGAAGRAAVQRPGAGVDVRYLQWLSGRLRLQWQSLHAQHQEHCKLLHRIHLLTSGSHMDQSLGHLSVTELDLIRQPESCKQLLQLLESETMQLEAFLEWKQLEAVYWQWMETVLDSMAGEGSTCESQDAHVEDSRLAKGTPCCPWADSLGGQIQRLSRDLMTLQDRLHELVTHRRAAWCEKVKTRKGELQKEGFPATARKIQESVELKLLDLTHLCAPNRSKAHGSCRLVFRGKQPASQRGFSRSASKEPVSAVSAAEVIRELQMREASLQRELRQLQEECRQRLDEMAEGLEGVICVSP